MRSSSVFVCLLLLLILFGASPTCSLVHAQDDVPAEQPAVENFRQSVAQLTAQLGVETEIDDESRQQIAALLKAAQTNIQQIEVLRESKWKSDKAAADAQDKATKRIKQLEELNDKPLETVLQKADVADLEIAAVEAKRKVDALKETFDKIETRINVRNEKRKALVSNLEAITERLSVAQEKLQALPVADLTLGAEAQRLESQSVIAYLEMERDAVEAEQIRMEAEDAANYLRHQRDLDAERLERAEEYFGKLQKTLDAKRQEKAQNLAETAAQKQASIEDQFPQLVASYKTNTSIADRGQQVESQLQDVTKKRDALHMRLNALKELKRETESRVKSIGLSGAVGAMLRKRRADLGNDVSTYLDAEAVKDDLDEIQFERFDIEQELASLNPEVVQQEIEQDINRELTKEELTELEKPIDELIAARRERLSAVNASLDRMFNRLVDVRADESAIEKVSADFRDYINERILWIRSNDILFSEINIDESDKAALEPGRWSNALEKIVDVFKTRPALSCLSALIILLLLMFKQRMRNEIDRLGQVAGKGSCETFWPTSHALFLSILIGVTIPMIPLLLGIGIYWSSPSDNSLFDSIGVGLLAVAWFSLPMEVLRRMCRPKGLANMHFDWPDKSVQHLKRNLDWMVLPTAVIVFTVALLHNLDVAHRVDLVERVLFVIGMGVFGVFLYRTLDPKTGIFAAYLKANEKSWANQLSLVWFGFVLLIPLAMAGLTIWGYYYTALNLSSCTYATLVFALIVETVRAIMRRLILLSRRRVHIAAARRKRELQLQAQREAVKAKEEADKVIAAAKAKAKADAREAAIAKAQGREESVDETDIEIDTSKLPAPATDVIPTVESLLELRPDDDIDENAQRATKLIGLLMLMAWAIGLWLIWAEVLPALKYLDGIQLWSTNVVETVAESDSTDGGNGDANGGSTTTIAPISAMSSGQLNASTTNEKTWVTFRDLLSSIAIALLTLVGARNFPAAIEMLFLDHLPVDRSFRYATKALTSYAITMLGIVFAFNALSIGWDNVQWLATALTFGLAFGLQEIFANFVAGIILMFERPIRIGDWITVDEFTGVVTKIRTRATTIVNWDRKEYVIPNKDFITGRLVNWTLSDAINRIVINVGVAYGADVVRAKKILLEICKNHPKTVSDPPTVVAFEQFGDSSLNLAVRTFIGDVESRFPVIDDLHTQINQAFADAGIEISFPQRDLHIRSVDAQALGFGFVKKDEA